jgi:hypothetical protein
LVLVAQHGFGFFQGLHEQTIVANQANDLSVQVDRVFAEHLFGQPDVVAIVEGFQVFDGLGGGGQWKSFRERIHQVYNLAEGASTHWRPHPLQTRRSEMDSRNSIVQSWPAPDHLESRGRETSESGGALSTADTAAQGADLATDVAEGVDLGAIGSSVLDVAGSAVDVVGGALGAVGDLLGGIGDALN